MGGSIFFFKYPLYSVPQALSLFSFLNITSGETEGKEETMILICAVF